MTCTNNPNPKARQLNRRWSAGRRWRGASACLSAFSPPRSISLNCGGAPRNPPPSPGACFWCCPGFGCAPMRPGYVKKNRELTQTGPYAYTRNPLYLGSMLIAAGFAVALLSWPVAAMLAFMFLIIYVPVIASEERFLARYFSRFRAYCRRVPRLIPRLTPGLANRRPNRSFVRQASLLTST